MNGYALFIGQGTASATHSKISTIEKNPKQDLELDAIPNGLSITRNVKVSSSDGKRIDPFAHQTGFHAGIDFSANPGTMLVASISAGIIGFIIFLPELIKVFII